jgi:hypothetical protein
LIPAAEILRDVARTVKKIPADDAAHHASLAAAASALHKALMHDRGR